jgi:hypothetical protein
MTRKCFSEDDILNVLRQIELGLTTKKSVEMAVCKACISDALYYRWRNLYDGKSKSRLYEFKSLKKRERSVEEYSG